MCQESHVTCFKVSFSFSNHRYLGGWDSIIRPCGVSDQSGVIPEAKDLLLGIAAVTGTFQMLADLDHLNGK